MSPHLALSWLNRPCGPKAAIGFGKRTLGHPRQSAALQGPQQGLLRVREPIFDHPGHDRRRIAGRNADERLAQSHLCRPIRHERSTFGLRLQPARPVFPIDITESASLLRLQKPRVEFADQLFGAL